MKCKNCGYEIDDNAVFCQWCGYAQTDDNFNALSQKSKNEQYNPKKNSSSRPAWLFIILAILGVVLISMMHSNHGAPSGTSDSSVSTTDLKQLTHSAAVETIKTVLFNSGITKFDRLGWYYDETYYVDGNIHYSTSKVDYNGQDHSYTVGVTFDGSNVATPVFISIDSEVVLKPELSEFDKKCQDIARNVVVGSASNPATVVFDDNSTIFKDEYGNRMMIERFDFVNNSGAFVTKEYYAKFHAQGDEPKLLSLSIGDTVIFNADGYS
ncbi:zinc-ribbon domain-containing protein [Anaerotruncus rubiinfantis]|uniref:zinc-ribbon domain-containing protein n=1 Tax=Anaerotruncus rubiinfantis TaxID=1720200 RepID=UPI00189C479D